MAVLLQQRQLENLAERHRTTGDGVHGAGAAAVAGPHLHWVSIWFAARNLLSDADEHPDHWDTKYEGVSEADVTRIRDDSEKEWRARWPTGEVSPNLEMVRGILRRFVGYKTFTPPEGL